VEIDQKNYRFFRSVALDLKNTELYFEIIKQYDEPLSVSNVIDRLCSCSIHGLCIDDMIKFAALEFTKLESQAEKIPIDILRQILLHPSLRVESEDWLYDFLIARSSCETFVLFESLQFECLSREKFQTFLKWSLDHFDGLTLSFWKVFCNRFIRCIRMELSNDLIKSYITECPFQSGKRLDGIIAHLTRQNGGQNVYHTGTVNVTAISIASQYAIENSLDFHTQSLSHTACKIDPWLCYDFQEKRVQVAAYSFQPYGQYCSGQWILEISNNKSDWIEIDRRNGTQEVLGRGLVTFSVADARQSHIPARFVRLKRLSEHPKDYLYFTTYYLEVYGSLIEFHE
jgi:hypothetical protein